MSVTSRGNTSAVRASTEVFNGNCPAAYANLDLSAYVGARTCFVFLRVYNDDPVNSTWYEFRPDGTTIVTAAGLGYGYVATLQTGLFLEKTSSSGIVEWMGNVARPTRIFLEGVIE